MCVVTCWMCCFKPEDSVVLLTSNCWYNTFPKSWVGYFKAVGSAVPLASVIAKTLIKLLCSSGHCCFCDSSLSKAAIYISNRGCSFLKVGNRTGGLFYCRDIRPSRKIKLKPQETIVVCGFTVSYDMCFYFNLIWLKYIKYVRLSWKGNIRRTTDTWTQTC